MKMQLATRILADRVDSFPDPWLPEPGDKLVGGIIDVAATDKGSGSTA
jgi:hypothetical protein